MMKRSLDRAIALIRWYHRLEPRRFAGLFLIALLLLPGAPVRAQDPGPQTPTTSGGQVPTAANAAVAGNTGTFTTSVEIDLPPGRVGMAPKLALGYASGGGNGVLGVGWSLPMTSINRLGARKGVPGQKVDFVRDEFYLSLNGAGGRLLPVEMTDPVTLLPMTENCGVEYAVNQTPPETYCVRRYHTEIESWLKAEAYYGRKLPTGSNVYTANESDLRFWVLTSKTGLIMHLGMSDASRLGEPGTTYRYAWYLDQSKDTHGNTIDYAYTPGIQSQGMRYYDAIRYGGYQPVVYGTAAPGYGYRSDYGSDAADLQPNFEIRFSLEPRRDMSVSYRGGYAQIQGERYREIYVVPLEGPAGEVLAAYRMEYAQSFKTGRSLLKRIRHYGRSSVSGTTVTPGMEYPSAAYTYRGEGQLPQGWEGDWGLGASFGQGNFFNNSDTVGAHDWGARLADVNGDGLPDKLDSFQDQASGETQNRVWLNTGNGYTQDPNGYVPGSVFAWHESSGGQVRDAGSALFDINGDGLADKVDYGGQWSSNVAYLGTQTNFSSGNFNFERIGAQFVKAVDGYPANVQRLPGFTNGLEPNTNLQPIPCDTCEPPPKADWSIVSGPGISSTAANLPSEVHFQVVNNGDDTGAPNIQLVRDDAPGTVIAPARQVSAPNDHMDVAFVYEGLSPGSHTFTIRWGLLADAKRIDQSFTVGSGAAVPKPRFTGLPAEGMSTRLNYAWECASNCTGAPEFTYRHYGEAAYRGYSSAATLQTATDKTSVWVKTRINGVESAPIFWRCLTNAPLPGPFALPYFAEYANYGVGTTLDYGTRPADLNGDGLTDLVTGYWDESGFQFKKVYLNSAAGYVYSPEWTGSMVASFSVMKHYDNNAKGTSPGGWDIADVNGDGLPDLVGSYQNSYGYANAVYFNNGRGFNSSSGVTVGGAGFVNPWSTPVADCDFCQGGGGVMPQAVNGSYKLYDGQRYGDAISRPSKDGAPEWFTAVTLNWKESPNIDTKTWLQTTSNRYMDVNGDGLPDIVTSQNSNRTDYHGRQVYINTGAGFRQAAAYTASIPDAFTWYNNDGLAESEGVQCDNFRGTGMLDCLAFRRNAYGNNTTFETRLFYKNRDEVPDLLVRIDNGFGGWTAVAYKPSTAALGMLGHAAEFPHTFNPAVTQLVSLLTVCDGRGQCYSSRYDYSGAYYDWRRQEQRGYRLVRQWEANSNPANSVAYIDTYYRQDWPFAGMVDKVEARTGDGWQVLSRAYNRYATSDLPTLLADHPRKLVVKTADRSDVYDPDLPAVGALPSGDYHYKYSTATTYAYDAFGSTVMTHALGLVNPTQQNPVNNEAAFGWTDADPADDLVTVTQYRYQGDEPSMTWGPWRVGFIRATQTRKTEPANYNEPASFPNASTLTATRYCYDIASVSCAGILYSYNKIKAGDLTHSMPWLDAPALDGNGAIRGNRWLYSSSAYNSYGQVIATRTPMGAQTVYEYSALNYSLLSKTTDALNQVSSHEYNEAGLPTASIDINGVRAESVYDGLWRLEGVKVPALYGNYFVANYSYNFSPVAPDPSSQHVETCKLQDIDAPTGTLSTLCSRSYFDGMMRSYAVVAPAPDPNDYANAMGVWSLTAWDARGLQVDSYRPFQAGYFDNPPAAIPAGQPKTHVEYDLKQRAIRTDYANGTRSLAAQSGLESLAVDGKNHWALHRVDGRGLLVSAKENDAGGVTSLSAALETTYAYDALGRLTTVTDPDQREIVSSVSYDTLGRKLYTVDADAGPSSLFYDDNGNLQHTLDARNVKTLYGYDPLNRLVMVDHDMTNASPAIHLPSSVYIDYGTDASTFSKGRVTSIYTWDSGDDPSPLQQESFLYDPLGRQISSTRDISQGTQWYQVTTSKTYRADGRVKTLTYPDGYRVTNEYSPDTGVLTSVHGGFPYNVNDGIPDTVFATFDQFNDVGQFTQGTLADGKIQRSIQYDFATGRALSQADQSITLRRDRYGRVLPPLITPLQRHDYADLSACAATASQQTLNCPGSALYYDAVGNLTQVASTVNGQDQSQNFTYDPLNRLTHATGAYGAADYAYEANGNIARKDGKLYGYDLSAPHVLASRQPVDAQGNPAGPQEDFGSDAAGNLVSAPGMAVQWDANGHPYRVDQTKDGVTRHYLYQYDSSGARVYKHVTGNPDPKDDYQRIYFGSLYEISIEGAPGSQFVTQTKHIYAGSARVATITVDSSANQFAAVVNDSTLKQKADGYALLAGFSHATGNPFSGAGRQAGLFAARVFYHQHAGAINTAFTFALALSLACLAAWLLNRAARRDLAALRAPVRARAFGWLEETDLPAWSWAGLRRMLRLLGRSLGGAEAGADDEPPRLKWRPLRLLPFMKRWQVTSVALTTLAGFLLQIVLLTGVSMPTYAQSVSTGTTPAGAPLGTRYYLRNHLGSSTLVLDETATVLETAVYKPFGELWEDPNQPQSRNHRFYFTGGEKEEFDLYQFGARWYSPDLGRFISADSIIPSLTDSQKLNAYSYTENNPVNLVDPSGHVSTGTIQTIATIFQIAGAICNATGVGAPVGSVLIAIGNALSVVAAAQGLYEAIRAGSTAGMVIGVAMLALSCYGAAKSFSTASKDIAKYNQTKLAEAARKAPLGAGPSQAAIDGTGGACGATPRSDSSPFSGSSSFGSDSGAKAGASNSPLSQNAKIEYDDRIQCWGGDSTHEPMYIGDKCPVIGAKLPGGCGTCSSQIARGTPMDRALRIMNQAKNQFNTVTKAFLKTTAIVSVGVVGGSWASGTLGTLRSSLVTLQLGNGMAYHHTFAEYAQPILNNGLRPGSFGTPVEGLSPLQASLENALPGGLRDTVVGIDLDCAASLGVEIPAITRVAAQFGMPGGGWEMFFAEGVPAPCLGVVMP